MTHHDHDPVRELLEQAREQRRREQPPPELFEAALGRLSLEERGMEERGRERRFSLSRALNVLQRSLFRLNPARLGLALAVTLAVLVSWRARRHLTLEPHQDVPTGAPTIALAAEPTPLHDATRTRNLGDSTEQPSAEQRPEPSAARASGARRPRVGGPAMERDIDPFYLGAPPVSVLSRDEAGVAHIESSGDKRKVAGFWTVESWTKKVSPRPALRQMPDRRQCLDVHRNERLLLGWRTTSEPGRPGFQLVQGQRYRLILPHVSVTGPVQLELIVIVGSSDRSHEPALVTHVMSVPSPSTVEFIFEPTHDDDRAAVSLFVDAVGLSGASKLCLGGARLDPQQTEAVAGTEPASAVVPATETKKKPAPKGSPEKPGDKPAKPAQPHCDPPWYIDANGIQRLKQNCF